MVKFCMARNRPSGRRPKKKSHKVLFKKDNLISTLGWANGTEQIFSLILKYLFMQATAIASYCI